MQGGRHGARLHELHEANPGLDVDARVPQAGVQPDILDFPQETEQCVHLIPRSLRGYVGYLWIGCSEDFFIHCMQLHSFSMQDWTTETNLD